MKIQFDKYDNWTCICGNTAEINGFQPCNEKGKLVEPTEEAWKKPLYKCMSCFRIIDQDTHEIVETIMIEIEDLSSWFERLENLRKCNLEPEKCTHDTNEEGEVQPFDYASIDMCLSQIVGEIKQYLK